MANLQKIYADLDLTFNKLPGSKDVAMRYDDQSVISSVRNLLLTNFYERPFQPLVGSNMNGLLFEPVTDITAGIIADEIKNVLQGKIHPPDGVYILNVEGVDLSIDVDLEGTGCCGAFDQHVRNGLFDIVQGRNQHFFGANTFGVHVVVVHIVKYWSVYLVEYNPEDTRKYDCDYEHYE